MIAVLLTTCLFLAPIPTSVTLPSPEDDAARECAESFRDALLSGDAAGLNDLLPSRGKVQVRLELLGPQEGAMSGSQVGAWFQSFLKRGKVESFEIVRVEQTTDYAVARCRASVRQANGFRGRVGLHLALQSEEGRWVVREIRESAE